MLAITPQTRALLRIRPKVRRVRQQRREAIVLAIVNVIREEKDEGRAPTLFTHEAAIWQALRRGLCLEGWRWPDANREAREILDDALKKANAVRPRWLDGQPHYTDARNIWGLLDKCLQCSKPLDEGAKTFCTPRCYQTYHTKAWMKYNEDKIRLIEKLRWRRLKACAGN